MSQTNQALQNKTAATRFYEEVVNQRKFYLIDELASADFVDHNPDPGQEKGLEGMKAMFRGFIEAFPDMYFRIDHMIAEGDRVGVRCTVTATHMGAFNGIPATGRKITVQGFDWTRYKNGKAVERWGVFDMAGMLQQLGVIPGPTGDELKKLSNKYYETLDATKGDIASMRDKLVDPMCATYFNGQGPLPLDAVQGMMKMFWGSFNDLKHDTQEQMCEGDVVYNRLTVSGTQTGEFNGIPASNKKAKIDVITCQKWANGKVVEQWINPDMVSLLQQIGAMPTP